MLLGIVVGMAEADGTGAMVTAGGCIRQEVTLLHGMKKRLGGMSRAPIQRYLIARNAAVLGAELALSGVLVVTLGNALNVARIWRTPLLPLFITGEEVLDIERVFLQPSFLSKRKY